VTAKGGKRSSCEPEDRLESLSYIAPWRRGDMRFFEDIQMAGEKFAIFAHLARNIFKVHKILYTFAKTVQ
jgi:hypothetical protein